MPLVTFQQIDHLGEIVIDSPPQNLFSGELLTDLRTAVDDASWLTSRTTTSAGTSYGGRGATATTGRRATAASRA